MSEIMSYEASNWFWKVTGESGYYASAHCEFVSDGDPRYVAFVESGGVATRIASMDELTAVLGEQYPAGLPIDLPAYAAQRRWEKEVAGIEVDGFLIATTRESQAQISGAVAYAQMNEGLSFQFKTEAGFVTLTSQQILDIGQAVAAHVQACFKWEADRLAEIESGDCTSEADIDSAG